MSTSKKIVAQIEECMCRLRNIALESVTEKCDRWTDRRTERQTDRRTDRRRTKWSLCRYAKTCICEIHLLNWNLTDIQVSVQWMDFGKKGIAESENQFEVRDNACRVAAWHEKVADAYSTAPGCKSLLEHYLNINKIRKINSQQVCWKSCCYA